jgi:branched-subunit amino acid aminotransferase/4-amino-4-deoxychorismate lyase
MSVWWGGAARSDDEVPLASDRALLLGDGLFETVLVSGGRAVRLAAHLERLARSAERFAITLPAGLEDTLAAAVPALWERERGPSRGALRITVSRGAGRGLAVPAGAAGLVVSFARLPDAPLGEPAPPATAVILDAPRVDPRDPLAGHKVISAMHRVEARRAANAAGADIALLLTTDGDVCEADAANVFAVLAGVVVTPPLDRGVLPGITRRACLDALAHEGRPCAERRLARNEIAVATEVFLTSSLEGVRPLRRVGADEVAGAGPAAKWLARCITACAPGSD